MYEKIVIVLLLADYVPVQSIVNNTTATTGTDQRKATGPVSTPAVVTGVVSRDPHTQDQDYVPVQSIVNNTTATTGTDQRKATGPVSTPAAVTGVVSRDPHTQDQGRKPRLSHQLSETADDCNFTLPQFSSFFFSQRDNTHCFGSDSWYCWNYRRYCFRCSSTDDEKGIGCTTFAST
ncbi:glycophorin-A isoform X1 [Choloepus didactylus]|uniref:glycophorin-A isoform X1 n=1 Tax=Choloepus didactylus TaxID=27675 RepID=UPI00189DBFA8|nr:glycophorin-A isoform X1 [Choloepus didactylus]